MAIPGRLFPARRQSRFIRPSPITNDSWSGTADPQKAIQVHTGRGRRLRIQAVGDIHQRAEFLATRGLSHGCQKHAGASGGNGTAQLRKRPARQPPGERVNRGDAEGNRRRGRPVSHARSWHYAANGSQPDAGFICVRGTSWELGGLPYLELGWRFGRTDMAGTHGNLRNSWAKARSG